MSAQAVGISGGIGANVQSAAQILKLVADCSHDHSFRTTSAQMPTVSPFTRTSGSSAESGSEAFTRHVTLLNRVSHQAMLQIIIITADDGRRSNLTFVSICQVSVVHCCKTLLRAAGPLSAYAW